MPAHGLRIAFYAPLKSPDHPVPSGDRLMARMLVASLEAAGHKVDLVSDLRAYIGRSDDDVARARLVADARQERRRIAALWSSGARPDLWFSYHSYYKSPDLLGPMLAAQFAIPLVTCEASFSARRDVGIWAGMQADAMEAVRIAALNITLTARDRAGLQLIAPQGRFGQLAPFIDTAPFAKPPLPDPGHLVAVAMMRSGDKLESYRALAAALSHLPAGSGWRLTIAGDGPARPEVEALFAGHPPGRVEFSGPLDVAGVADLLSRAAVYVWPGQGEAYGLAYLEAQAAGVPVVACRTAGVPEVVTDGEGGRLVDPGDPGTFAAAVMAFLSDPDGAARQGRAARARVLRDHSIRAATVRLDRLLTDVMEAGR